MNSILSRHTFPIALGDFPFWLRDLLFVADIIDPLSVSFTILPK